MNYESKFSIGDTVWMVSDERFQFIVKCVACVNTGQITIGGESFICPKCQGRAAHAQIGGSKFYVYDSSEVGCIEIKDTTYRNGYNEPNPRITYMLHSTGVGSGRVWDQERLFRTREEAQAFCDAHNGLLPANETELLEAPVDRFGKVV